MKTRLKQIKWTRIILIPSIALAIGHSGITFAQLPYTPLTTPLYGGSASQPPQTGTATSTEQAPESTQTSTVPSNQPGASASFRPQGSSLPSSALPTRGLTFHPRILVRETYSDNINLAPSNRAESDAITEVIPGFDLQAAGKRVQGSLSYSLQGVAYAQHSSSDHIYNQVSGNALGAIIPDHFFLSANTAYTQAVINPSAPASNSNIFTTGNTANAWISRVNPYWLQSLGPVGNARLSYAFGNIQYPSSGLSNSHSNTYDASFSSPSDNGRWSWSGNYHDYHEWVSNGRQIQQRDAQGELGYQVFNNITLLADGGWERNEQNQGFNQVFEGTYWAGGFRWSSPFNVLQFKYGHRFFGSTYDASWKHRAARFVTNLSYNETVTVVNQTLQAQALQASSVQTLPNVPLSSLNSFDLYVSKRFAGSIQYNLPRTNIMLTGYDERRDYLSQSRTEHVTGATMSGNWRAGARTSVSPSFTWAHDRYQQGQNYTLISPQIALKYVIGSTANAEVGYRYERRNGDVQSNSYTMNMIYVQFSKTF